MDELWDALAQHEMSQWKDAVMTPPQEKTVKWEAGLDSTENSNYVQLQKDILHSVVLNKQRILPQLRCGCLPPGGRLN